MENKREFIVKKAFKFNGEIYSARDRIVITGPVSEQAEARLGFGLKWRFIIPLVKGHAATLKDENTGKNTQDENVSREQAPTPPQDSAQQEPDKGEQKDPQEPKGPEKPKKKGLFKKGK